MVALQFECWPKCFERKKLFAGMFVFTTGYWLDEKLSDSFPGARNKPPNPIYGIVHVFLNVLDLSLGVCVNLMKHISKCSKMHSFSTNSGREKTASLHWCPWTERIDFAGVEPLPTVPPHIIPPVFNGTSFRFSESANDALRPW